MVPKLLKEGIHGVLPVEELPHVNAGGAQAKAMSGIRVEQNGPIVKLLAEHDERFGYGFVIVFYGAFLVFYGAFPFRPISPRTEQH